jgi:hypothetical protein
VIGILPGRLATRQRLLVGAMIVAGTSLLNLIAFELGPFGSPWPIALLWAVCGWTGLGPNVATSFLLFILGLWVDTLTGAQLGTWAFVALISHSVLLLFARFLGTGTLGRVGSSVVCGGVMFVVMLALGFWQHGGFYILGLLLPLIIAVALYRFVGGVFELSEDAT